MCRGPRSSISAVPGNTGASHLGVGADATLLPDPFEAGTGRKRKRLEARAERDQKSIAEMQRVALNNYIISGTLTVMFVMLVVVMGYFTIRMSLHALRSARPSANETPPVGRAEGLAGAAT
jgi:hypothetical protein